MPDPKDYARSLLHDAWIKQLYLEVQHIYFAHGLKLPMPVLRLAPMERRWGQLETLTRTITLHPDLITQYGWHVTTQVLRHELAHLFVSTHYPNMPPHGNAFKLACARLGVEDWAALASGALPETLPKNQQEALGTEEEERLLKKVEKLLNLAQSSNEHEALLAMQRVQELYARYNLERLRDKRTATWVRHVIELKKKRMDRNQRVICSILNEHFFVRTIFSQLYEPLENDTFKTIELLGTRENVQMAEYVYHFLLNQTRVLFEARKDELATRRSSRSDFVLGALLAFRKKLDQEKNAVFQRAANASADATGGTEAARSSSLALIRASDPGLDTFVARIFPRLRTTSGSTSYRDEAAFHAGKEEGHKLVIHKGVSSGTEQRGRLLGGG